MGRPAAGVLDVEADGLRGRVHSTFTSELNGDAPTFVLLHGIGMSHRYFSRLQQNLARVGTTHSFDLPGFGPTPKPSYAVSVAAYAAFLERVLDRLGVASCVLVGHSMGAQFATELARRRPTLVSHLVLIGPVVDSTRRTVARQTLALARDSLREPLSANTIVFTDYLRCGPAWYLTELREMMTYPIEDRVAEVHALLLVVRGMNDPVADSAWCSALAHRAANGRLLEVPGRRHVVQHSAAAQVAAAIAGFARSDAA